MLPLGLLLFAQDVPFLQPPMARMLGWVERRWIARQRAKAKTAAVRRQIDSLARFLVVSRRKV
jgi:hypothetical protein